MTKAAGDLAQFDYPLPSDRIAQEPAEPRDAARLLVLDRRSGVSRDSRLNDLGAYQKASRMPIDCWPSETVLDALRKVAAR